MKLFWKLRKKYRRWKNPLSQPQVTSIWGKYDHKKIQDEMKKDIEGGKPQEI